MKTIQTYSDARDVISSGVVFSGGCRSLHRRAHSIPIVLTHKDAWQVPQFSHVVGFKHL